MRDLLHGGFKIPRGLSQFHDLRKCLNARVVFDVGANVGQSAEHYLRALPKATIYCFEPIAETFEKLQSRFSRNRRVLPFHLALGSSTRDAKMLTDGASDMFRISDDGTETVHVCSLDDFCSHHEIENIDYLKIDTEGYELQVLQGAERLLQSGMIRFIELEAGMNPDNDRHTPMELIKDHLEKRDYRLFGIYEQINEWPTSEPWLRRTNLVFMAKLSVGSI